MRASFLSRVLVLALAAIAAHLAFTAGIAAAMYFGYPHRIYDVTRWYNDKERSALIAAFLHSRPSELVFVGSSFTFGYPWQEPVIFTRLLGGTNVSVIGMDFNEIHNLILCNLGEWHPRTLVIEIPVINSVDNPKSFLGCRPTAPLSYFAFAFRRPIGTGWLPFLWDNEAYPKPDAEISISPVSDDYFRTTFDHKKLGGEIVQVLKAAKEIAPKVYVLPSPVYLPGVTQVGRDVRAVREQLDFALATCREVPGVECLDPSEFYDKREYYYNMTHLNQRGHRAMAEWLAQKLK